jgi:large subunit ribosomal protein L32e
MSEPKSQLNKKQKKLLKYKIERSRRRTPFRRQEWFRYARFSDSWRKPRGKHSKLREHLDWRPPVVDAGFRSPKIVRGLHPSGFREVMVNNENDLASIDPKVQAARIASSVGTRKKLAIQEKADELNIKVLNRMVEGE